MKIDISQIPEETGKRFGKSIYDGIKEYLKQPGAREALEERTKARKARKEMEYGHKILLAVPDCDA